METGCSSYKEPSEVLKRLFLPPKDPSLTISQDYQWLVVTQEPPLPSIELLAKAEEKLAGIRFDPELYTPSCLNWAESLVLQHMSTGETQSIDLSDLNSEGIRYIRFHPFKSYFVFTSKVGLSLELYKCELVNGKWIPTKICLNDKRMNFVFGCAYQFTSDGDNLLIKVIPENDDWPMSPPPEPVSTGPSIQEVQKYAKKAPGRTYQDLLKNQFDEAKFKYYFTTELLRVDTKSLVINVLPQTKGGKMIKSLESSPCGEFLLAQTITKLSYSVPIRRFGKDVQLWKLNSKDIIEIESLPVDDEIPLSYDACSRHPRSFQFHPCKSHTVIYAKATDGGMSLSDKFEGERDALYYKELDFQKGSMSQPEKLVGLEWRFSGIHFSESGLALLDEYRWNDRMERKHILKTDGSKLLLWERSWEDRYTAPGEPIMRRGKNGKQFIIQPTPTSMYLEGPGASPLGDRPFLDLLDFSDAVSLKTTHLWRCTAPLGDEELEPAKEVSGVFSERKDVYESFIALFPDNLTIMISRESKTVPRNYYLTKLTTSTDDTVSSEVQLTDRKHPQPDLLGVMKEMIHYKRDDGVPLTANLYLPSSYDGTPRPTLFWAYPREFKDAKAAGQVRGSKHRFISAHWASPIHWAAKGWVVVDDFSLPIVGEADEHPNDTFIDQVISGATAAVEYVVKRGVTDPEKCAVGGHSYGAFMTAHLLSHTSLFAAGIGRSGAYNRTLTPMSFQSEDRSIWDAQDIYITMSPLMHVKKYSEQKKVGKMLLLHGGADENSGTFPMQSERYFAALKAYGIESRLVILPHERHSYRAKESILHMAWEQEQWLNSIE